jgi:FixJ family two-component response regulator
MTANRVYVVDDDRSVRAGLKRLLTATGFDVEAFESAAAFLSREHYDGPACLVLDLSMPALTGTELQARLVEADSTLPIIFLSGHAEIEDSVRAMKHGALDFLTKPVDEEVLLAAVRNALEQHRQRLGEAAELQAIRERMATLTERELEIATWVITGLLNKQIATELGIAEKTVKIHRSRVMEKMGVTSVAELVRLFAQLNISQPGPRP